MAPGPKKKSFHTPRNNKSNQSNTANEEKKPSLNNESSKNADANLDVDFNTGDNLKYNKRSVESNWKKYEEPEIDPHRDYNRGRDFEVLLSYSGGSGSQLKLQDEKDWEDDSLNVKDISLNFRDLLNSMKCLPFHERINVRNIFSDKHISNFISTAENWQNSYKSQVESQALSCQDTEMPVEPFLAVEEPESTESDDLPSLKTFVVQDKTVEIINSIASNLTFKEFPEKETSEIKEESQVSENEKKIEASNNDLDFLLSLNISSKVSAEETTVVSESSNVDDWLNSILDA